MPTKTLRLAAAIAIAVSCNAAEGPKTTYRKVLQAVTTPQTSQIVSNSGQAVHVLTVIFPAAVSNVSGFSARLEASLDPSSVAPTWIPISEDLTAATLHGDFAFAIVRANGTYPAVRARYVTAHPTLAMDAYYSGAAYPIGRFEGLQSSATRHTWILCQQAPCEVGPNQANLLVAQTDFKLTKCYIAAKSSPSGASLIVDVLKNGTSIFGASGFALTAGSTLAVTTTLTNPHVLEADILTISILQIGAITPGQAVTVTCRS